jgi:hypothetical protein
MGHGSKLLVSGTHQQQEGEQGFQSFAGSIPARGERINLLFLLGHILAWGKKKADVAEHPMVFDHVGILVDSPPGAAGLLFT